MKNEAVGAYEAAGIMGVHFSRPRRLAEKGDLSSRVVGGGKSASFAVYSLRECEENWRDYEELVRSGELFGRPRAWESNRPAALRALGAKGRPQILFEDAIGVDQAAEILRVFPTRVPRMIEEGKLIARRLWSDRASESKLWIVSKKSAEALAKSMDAAEREGTKRGRRRHPA
jgi:hypothetical protein